MEGAEEERRRVSTELWKGGAEGLEWVEEGRRSRQFLLTDPCRT